MMMKVGGAGIEYVSTGWDDMVGGWLMPSLAGTTMAVKFSWWVGRDDCDEDGSVRLVLEERV